MRKPGRPAIVRLLAVAVIFVGIEVSAALLIWVATPLLDEPIWRTPKHFRVQLEKMRSLIEKDSTSQVMLDSLLGWRYRPGFQTADHLISKQGLRGERLYDLTPPPGVLRVAAFGDSFVYGNEVKTHQSWPAFLETQAPDIEILNYGVGGYGVDQALLRFLTEGSDFEPHVVIMGFVTDDLSRLTNVYRPFRSAYEWPLVKPRYTVAGGELTFYPPPLTNVTDYEAFLNGTRAITELGTRDEWYEPLVYDNPAYDLSATVRLVSHLWTRLRGRYLDPDRLFDGSVFNTQSEAFAIQMALFREFVDSARYRGYAPLIVLLPDRKSLAQVAQGKSSIQAPLAQALDSAGLPYLDMVTAFGDEFTERELQEWFMPGRHYSEAGNRQIAKALGDFLWLTYAPCRSMGEDQGSSGGRAPEDQMCRQSFP